MAATAAGRACCDRWPSSTIRRASSSAPIVKNGAGAMPKFALSDTADRRRRRVPAQLPDQQPHAAVNDQHPRRRPASRAQPTSTQRCASCHTTGGAQGLRDQARRHQDAATDVADAGQRRGRWRRGAPRRFRAADHGDVTMPRGERHRRARSCAMDDFSVSLRKPTAHIARSRRSARPPRWRFAIRSRPTRRCCAIYTRHRHSQRHGVSGLAEGTVDEKLLAAGVRRGRRNAASGAHGGIRPRRSAQAARRIVADLFRRLLRQALQRARRRSTSPT